MPASHTVIIGNSQHMPELSDCSIHLMLTSPPYPMIKMWDSYFSRLDSRIAKLWKNSRTGSFEEVRQIYDRMHANLSRVWEETHRVLVDGGIACINIGDATRTINGRFQLFANHSKVIECCERIGFITVPYILWKKPTTKPMYKGKGAFLGSGFLPPNAYVTLDCEFILLFRKGDLRKFPPKDQRRYESMFTKAQRDIWFSQIWTVTGARQTDNAIERRIAAFPDEIVERLIRMFSVKGETVLDPFLGSGTATKVAMLNDRCSIGYEIDKNLVPLMKRKIGAELLSQQDVKMCERPI